MQMAMNNNHQNSDSSSITEEETYSMPDADGFESILRNHIMTRLATEGLPQAKRVKYEEFAPLKASNIILSETTLLPCNTPCITDPFEAQTLRLQNEKQAKQIYKM